MEKSELIKKIELRIAEHSLAARYSNLQITEIISEEPKVGIWWFLQGRVIKVEKSAKDCFQDDLICIEVEHNKTFPFMQKKYAEEIPEILEVKYNQIERGRVWAAIDPDKPDKVSYMITCSTAMTKNYDAIAAIKKSFGLSRLTVKVQAHGCMYDWEIKL